MAGEPVMLVHCATSQYLYTDKIDYRNQFGIEYEVSALCAATKRCASKMFGLAQILIRGMCSGVGLSRGLGWIAMVWFIIA